MLVKATLDPDPTKLEGDNVRPAGRAHMKDLLDAIASRGKPSPTSRRATCRPRCASSAMRRSSSGAR
jgi:hypothetical protein